jgi:hypothetical protein
MLPQRKAELTIYLGSHCGYCHTFSGIKDDGSIDPNSGLEILKRDQELARAGIFIKIIKTGIYKNPKTGQNERHGFEAINSKRSPERVIRGVPHFEISLPGDRVNGTIYTGNRKWKDGAQSSSELKRWALQMLVEKPYVRSTAEPIISSSSDEIEEPLRFRHERNASQPKETHTKMDAYLERKTKKVQKSIDDKPVLGPSSYSAANDD